MNLAEVFFHQPWVIRLGWTLLHFLWQGTLLALLFAAARRFAGRVIGARGRYGLACAALAMMCATPLLTFLAAGPLTSSSAIPRTGLPLVPEVLPQVLACLVAIWFLGAMLFSARAISGWRMTAWLRSVSAGVVPLAWEAQLQTLIRRIGVTQRVQLLISPMVDVPTVIGWLQPMILMPVSALSGLPIVQIEALLAHELAHIRRQDYLVNVLQNIAEALLFYHPAIWWISRQIRIERELCCDDIAVEASGDVLIYVQALTDLDSHRRAKLNLAGAVAADGGSLVNRIRRLIGPPEPPSRNLTSPGAAWALGALWLLGIAAATVHGAPGPVSRVRPFTPPVRAVHTAVASTQLVPIPDIQPSPSPAVTALLFDPFFQILTNPISPNPNSPDAPPEQKPGRVEGTVTSSGQIVKKASVRLSMANGPSGQQTMSYLEISDDSGKFAIDDVPPGTYTLSAQKGGYLATNYGARTLNGPGASITVESDSVVKNIDVSLFQAAIISGRVTNEDGDPVPRTFITLYRATYIKGRRTLAQLTPPLAAQADENGNFKTLEGIAPGRYYVAARPPDQPMGPKPVPTNIKTFYPNSPDYTRAIPIDVPPGGQLPGIDIRLRRDTLYSVKGTATYNGAPIKSTQVELTLLGESIYSGGARNTRVTDGKFEFRNVTPGTYLLRVMRSIAPQQGMILGMSGGMPVTVGDSNVEVNFAMTPGAEVTGLFTLEGGDWVSLYPQPQAADSKTDAKTDPKTNPKSLPPPIFYPSIGLTDPVLGFFDNPAHVNSDGTFKLRTVPPDRYQLEISGLPRGTYVKSIRYGGRDFTHSLLDLQPGPGTLEVVLVKNAATMGGIVHNDKGDALIGVYVTIWPKTPNPGDSTAGSRTVRTDQNGMFKLGNLPPGDYYAVAWDKIDTGLAQTPAFLNRFTSQAGAASLNEGSQAGVNLTLIPDDAIAREVARLP